MSEGSEVLRLGSRVLPGLQGASPSSKPAGPRTRHRLPRPRSEPRHARGLWTGYGPAGANRPEIYRPNERGHEREILKRLAF